MCTLKMLSVILLTATFKINTNLNGLVNSVTIGTRMIKGLINVGVSVLPLFSPTVTNISVILDV